MWSKIRFQFLILLAVEGLILPKTANSKVSKSHLRRSIGAVIVFHINDSTSLLTPTTAIVVKPVVTENASSFQNLLSQAEVGIVGLVWFVFFGLIWFALIFCQTKPNQ